MGIGQQGADREREQGAVLLGSEILESWKKKDTQVNKVLSEETYASTKLVLPCFPEKTTGSHTIFPGK